MGQRTLGLLQQKGRSNISKTGETFGDLNKRWEHQPVLRDEVVNLLRINENGFYVDGTLGLGGHAEAILKQLGPKGKLLGLDVNADNLAFAKNRLQPFEDRTITRRTNFRGLQGILREMGWTEVHGMIFDLGVSSPHFDQAERGFSFLREGPLDMRLDPSTGAPLSAVLRSMSQESLMNLFNEFGEGRSAKRLSRAIINDARAGLLKTTTALAGLCERIVGRHGRTHPATRVFLALRTLVNDELGALKAMLTQAPSFLTPGGRLAVISFHSLEDRIVKHMFKELHGHGYAVLTKKPILPSEAEIQGNPRARGAKLRVLEKNP